MTKRALPRDVMRVSLDYSQLVATLDAVIGEVVIVRLGPRDGVPGPSAGLASLVGVLHKEDQGRYDGHEFSVGNPYPDRAPEHLSGGVFFVSESSFEAATLSTIDGNDYFVISVLVGPIKVLVQGVDSMYP